MFGRLFGSKSKEQEAKPKAPPIPKLKRSNLKRRFSILAEAGQGSMSTVYRAIDNQVGRLVCLKVQDAAKTTAAIGRAAMEGRPPEGVVGAQIRHRNVVKTFDFGISTKKEHFLTMEFIEGVSLSQIREARSRDLASMVDLLTQAAEGLGAVHAAGFLHHDFGPKNVLVTRENVAKIIDFGLAVPNTPTFRRPGNRTGTLDYMAPEVLRREPKSERIDVFSWGVTAFELLTGRPPYEPAKDQMTLMRQRMNEDPIDIAEADPRLPDELCAIVRRAIARRPADRWASMTQVVEALKELPIASREAG